MQPSLRMEMRGHAMIQPVAPENLAVGAGLFWNPGAISYLSQLLLAFMLSAYLARRVQAERRQGRDFVPTLLFCLTIGFLVPALVTALFHAMSGGGWLAYAMPWLSEPSFPLLSMPWISFLCGSAAAAFVQFAYRFPRRLAGTKRESMIVGAIMVAMLLVEVGIAIRTDIALLSDDPWMRPDWFATWLNVSTLWLGSLFVRQYLQAQRVVLAKQPTGILAGIRANLQACVRAPANREAKAARGFLIFALLPIVHTTALVLQSEGLLGPYPMDILICWSVLAQLTGFTLVYLGYLPERSSFLFKLTTISVVLLLATVNGACWIVAPGYFSQFRAPGMVVAGQEVRFSPKVDGGYAVGDVPLAPEPVAGAIVGPKGAQVPLPFDFRFYGRVYRTIQVAGDGTIGFEHLPQPTDVVFRYGARPAIYPLLVAVPESGTSVRVRVHPRRVVVTRRDRCAPLQERCYGFQAVLHANGRIDFAYLAMPVQPRFQPFEPLAAPWLMGITPGHSADAAIPANTRQIIRDYHRDFLTHLDRLYAPIVPFLIAAVFIVLVGMPLLFRGFLVRPLERLLRGIRRFRDGELGTQVNVSFNDEIGYLTESFNAMARSQHDMVNGLEAMVAERVEEVSDIAARNAQLEERARLSADLHDSVSQTLFSAALLADAVPEQWRRDPKLGTQALTRLAELNRNALSEMRLLLAELRSGAVDQSPPGERIKALASEFQAEHGASMHVEVNGGGALPPEVRSTFHRIAQECLNNIARHAGASAVRVTFEGLPGQALLVIDDDGCGFDPAGVEGDHLGLQIMRERAERIGATLEIESVSGRGTTVTLVWMEQDDG